MNVTQTQLELELMDFWMQLDDSRLASLKHRHFGRLWWL